jgi:uncharacterized protein involved in type VI secretion and phage assembly
LEQEGRDVTMKQAELEIGRTFAVVFEHGDMRRPIIIGGLWNGTDKPPRPPVTQYGHDNQMLLGGDKVKQRLNQVRVLVALQ